MRKFKEEKGITLVALIITIVVLLILAGVAIGAAKDSQIIGYAQNAAGGYNQAKTNEIDAISDYEDLMKEYESTSNNYTFTLNDLGEWEKSDDSIIIFNSSNLWKKIGADLSQDSKYYIEELGCFAIESANDLFDGYVQVNYGGEELKEGAQFLIWAFDGGTIFAVQIVYENGADVLSLTPKEGELSHEEFMRLYGDVEFSFVDISSLEITM